MVDKSPILDMKTTSTPTTSMESTSMDIRQLHSSQQEAMKKIIEFSGESIEMDIDEWLYDLTNLFSLMKLKDETKILETMGKLTGSALRWYQENLTSFNDWRSAEKSLRNRFKPFISDSQLMQEFFQLRQEENQSITSFYENVIRKYRKARTLITEQQVITVLQTGVKHSLKEYLIRNEQDITKPEEWLTFAREEEYIQQRIQQQRHVSPQASKNKPYFDSFLPTATVQYKPLDNQRPGHHAHKPQHHYQSKPYAGGNYQAYQQQTRNPSAVQRRQITPEHATRKPNSCLICNRSNHRTMECYHKKENGCFKCGQSTHRVRHCPQRHFFE
jgi:hypothetical protein